jgi:hypothetical protein
MDHLPIPESCKPNLHQVSYLGQAPKYDHQGFDRFLGRHGRTSTEILSSHRILQWPGEFIGSLIQEWLWFGLLRKFGIACNIPINLDEFVVEKETLTGVERVINTSSRFLENFSEGNVSALADLCRYIKFKYTAA